MVIHYVYEELPEDTCDSSLCQGDILKKTPELTELLAKTYPYYATNPSYKYFMVLTQSCDLFCRKGCPPSSPYITIAGVRPVKEAILREAKKHQDWWQIAVSSIDRNNFDQLVLFTESLLDNNIPNYFYIHEDVSVGISGQNCAFLAESVALTSENYELCLKARVAQIKETFRAKLGWLVGNMYSRVGTEEWDQHYRDNPVRKEASSLLKGILVPINKDQKNKGIKELEQEKVLSRYSPNEIFDHIQKTKIVSRKKRFSDRLIGLSKKFKLIGPVCSVLTREISSDDNLKADLQEVLNDCKNVDVESLIDSIISIIIKKFNSILREKDFPTRDRIIKRIIETIKQDSVIRNILD